MWLCYLVLYCLNMRAAAQQHDLHSLQERASKISHGGTARLAKQYGDPLLAQICGHLAADEGRHETAYTRIVNEFFRLCVPHRTPLAT